MAGKCRVLLVDDEEDACLVLGDLLEDCDCRVTAVSSPRQAVEIGSREAFDLVILDIRMPEMEGTEVLRRIRGRGHRQIIMLTGYIDDEVEAQALADGAAAVMHKPVDIPALFARIDSLRPRPL